jgi:sulfite reductase alpha subunit-like flavoprotein
MMEDGKRSEREASQLLILVGTQTGTAEELGGRLAFVARKHGFATHLLPFDQFDMVRFHLFIYF